jgi:hypothetical protein
MKILTLFFLLILITSCSQPMEIIDRNTKIPTDITKMTPEMDLHPPILHSDEFEQPVPLAIVNTAGGEDSPFIYNDELYFFFTPDVRIPAEKQVIDGVTGIYLSKNVNGAWQEPERVALQKRGKLSLDGCQFVNDNLMYFCTAREGYTGLYWFSAERENGQWTNWKLNDFNPEYNVGELHIYEDELYFHADHDGNLDIWVSKKANNQWQSPQNLEIVNSPENEGWPYVSSDGQELWFLRTYLGTPALFRSFRTEQGWTEPELIMSQFAGEPTLDNQGNLYFVHHYYKDSVMLEADIYVAYKK